MSHNAHLQGPESGSDGAAMPSGPVREALRLAVRLLDMAELRQRPNEMAQALAQVGRCYRALDALAPAESYLSQALRWARTLGAQDLSVELMCDLAEVACSVAEPAGADDSRGSHAARDRARDHAFEAAAEAGRAADPHWEIKVLLRVSDVLDRCGDHDDAIALQTRALTLMCTDTSTHAMLDLAEAPRSAAPGAWMQ
jgi:tetratricopeptide (TPR) repeat protein